MRYGKRILEVKIKHILDDSPDTSWLGEYSNTPRGEFSIDRAHSEDCASLEHNHRESVDRLERIISHLNAWRIEEGNKSDSQEWESLDESLDVLVSLQDDLMECDCSGGNIGRNEYRYFNPGSVEPFKVDASWIPADVTDKRAYWEKAMRKNARQDYARMEALQHGDFCFIGIEARAEIAVPTSPGNATIQRITSGGLWGVESDARNSYLTEIEQEELSALASQLYTLGFSKRAISTAFKNVKRGALLSLRLGRYAARPCSGLQDAPKSTV